MKRLWTPWRMGYVTKQQGHVENVFLDALASAYEPDTLVLHRGEHSFIIMNLFPYNSGHMMVVPNEAIPSIEDLNSSQRAEMFELVNLAVLAARPVLRCDGFNIGLNIGSVAGAGITEHLHIHVVPRWVGDANFMPITADTMVLPELLPTTYARLRAELETILARQGLTSEQSAGAIVYLPELDKVVLRRAQDGQIVVPKGHIEPGESAAEAAIREVHEETGYEAILTGWAGSEIIPAKGTGSQHVVYFTAVGRETPDVAAHLGTDVELVGLDQAVTAIEFDSLREIVVNAINVIRITSEN